MSGVATTGANAWEVTSQAAAMLIKVVPAVLLTSARGNRRFVIGRVMANILLSSLVKCEDLHINRGGWRLKAPPHQGGVP